jgi:hypothetical protein
VSRSNKTPLPSGGGVFVLGRWPQAGVVAAPLGQRESGHSSISFAVQIDLSLATLSRQRAIAHGLRIVARINVCVAAGSVAGIVHKTAAHRAITKL